MKKLFTLFATVALFATATMAQSKVTVTYNFTDPSNVSLSDYTAGDSYGDTWYQWKGDLSDDGQALAYICVNASSMTASILNSDVDYDYTAIVYLDNNGNTCEAQGYQLDSANVRENLQAIGDNAYIADYVFSNDDTIWRIHFEASDPYVEDSVTINVPGGLIQYNEYWDYFESYGYNMFITQVMDEGAYAFQAYVLVQDGDSNDVSGTYTEADCYSYGVYEYNADSAVYYSVANPFTANLTYSKVGDTMTLAAEVLCYNNTKYIIHATGYIAPSSNPEGIENVDAVQYQTYTEGRSIVVKGAQNSMVEVYDMVGRQVSSMNASSDEVRLQAPAAGVYIVRVNGKAQRVVVQ